MAGRHRDPDSSAFWASMLLAALKALLVLALVVAATASVAYFL